MVLIKRIPEGGLFPRFYGMAWWDILRDEVVCMPIPLNLIAGWFRWLWHGLKARFSPGMTALDRRIRLQRRLTLDREAENQMLRGLLEQTEMAKMAAYNRGWADRDAQLRKLLTTLPSSSTRTTPE